MSFYHLLNSHKQFLNNEILLRTKHLIYNRNQLFKIIKIHEGIRWLKLRKTTHTPGVPKVPQTSRKRPVLKIFGVLDQSWRTVLSVENG